MSRSTYSLLQRVAIKGRQVAYKNRVSEPYLSGAAFANLADLVIRDEIDLKAFSGLHLIPRVTFCRSDLVTQLRNKQVKIISEIEFAGYYTRGKSICVTGSNGKTTTASLTYHILKNAGVNVGLGGNIGQSFAKQVAEENFDWIVLELSSFQLDGMFDFKADIAVLLNITPDHLDRYEYNMQNYVDSKFRIIQNQTNNDWFIYNFDDALIQKEIEKRSPVSQQAPFSLTTELNVGGYVNTGWDLVANLVGCLFAGILILFRG